MRSIKPDSRDHASPRKGIYLLPNLITTAALFAGFYAVVAAMDGNFQKAAIAIFVALVLDGLDGRVARLTSTQSDFGKEFDSLADMVSFGLAPALIVYQWGIENLASHIWFWERLGWLAAFFFAVAAAMRLARFNARGAAIDRRYFEGLPSPPAAALVAGYIWFQTEQALPETLAMVVAFALTISAGALMVSSFRYLSFKEFNLGQRVPFGYLLFIPLLFIVISLSPSRVLFAMALLYAGSGPIVTGIMMLRQRRRRETAGTDSTDTDRDAA